MFFTENGWPGGVTNLPYPRPVTRNPRPVSSHPPRYLALDLAPFAGRYVALVEGEIIAVGETATDAQVRARLSRPQRAATVLFVAFPSMTDSSPSEQGPLLFGNQPAAQRAHAAVLRAAPEAVMVGGGVRDWMLGLAQHDLDYVLPGDALSVARQVADANGWAFYPLDSGRGTGRVVWKQAGEDPFIIDLATEVGGNLDADLLARDFTINAIALLPDGHTYDPLGGIADLQARRLRPCSSNSLLYDPLRVLRGVRMLFAFHLQPAPGLEGLARAALPGLSAVSAERQRDELCRLLALPEPHQVLTYVGAWDALPLLMPELVALQGITQSQPHIYDAYEHTLVAVRWVARIDRLLRRELQPSDEIEVALAAGLASLAGRLQAYLEEELSAGRPRWLALRIAALAHDWGKAMTSTADAGQRIHFYGHDAVSARLAAAWLDRFHFSSGEIDFVRQVCNGHMRPVTLAQGTWTPSRRSLYRLYRDFGGDTPALALLYAADTLATYGPDIDRDIWRQHVAFVAALLKPAFGGDAGLMSPKSLLDGREVMALTGLLPGPRLGEVLERLREAQAVGEVMTLSEAEAFVQRLAQA